MAEKNRIYIAIDLKSFYASVECVERGLDPLTTNLVVADASLARKELGWVPRHDDLDTIVGHALAWEEALIRRNRI